MFYRALTLLTVVFLYHTARLALYINSHVSMCTTNTNTHTSDVVPDYQICLTKYDGGDAVLIVKEEGHLKKIDLKGNRYGAAYRVEIDVDGTISG